MGTTCTAVVLRDGHIWLGHVGDSRAYLIRKGKIFTISEDTRWSPSWSARAP